jgi:hypothetical protein
MDWKNTVLLVVGALCVLVTFLGRYELVGVPAGGEGIHGIAYRLDRWTGEVTFISGPNAGRVEIK